MHADWLDEELKLLGNARKSRELIIAAPLVDPWATPCLGLSPCGQPAGYGIEMTNTICSRLKIVCKFIYQNVTSSGDFQTELANSILYGNVDTALPMLRPTPDLAVNLNFSVPAFFTEDAILVKTEFVDPTDYLFVMKPFRPMVWALIILSLIGVVFLDGLCQLAHDISQKEGVINKMDILRRVEKSWLYHLATLLQRSNDKPVFFWSRRFLIIGWGFSALLLGSTYSAMLVSYRVAPTADTPYTHLDNLADAMAQRKLNLIVFHPDSDFVRQVQQRPINEHFRRFHEALKIKPPLYTSNITFGAQAVLSSGNFAFYGSLLTLRSVTSPNCTLTLVPLGISRWGAYAFPKRNTLQFNMLFNKAILSFLEIGYYREKLEQKYDNNKRCAEKAKSAQTSRDVTDVDTVNLLFVFLALICGYGAGTFVLLMEKTNIRCRKCRSERKLQIVKAKPLDNWQEVH